MLFEPNLITLYSAAHIIFNPLFWNIVARQEWHNSLISRHFKNRRHGVYFLFVVIFTLGLIRDGVYLLSLTLISTSYSRYFSHHF